MAQEGGKRDSKGASAAKAAARGDAAAETKSSAPAKAKPKGAAGKTAPAAAPKAAPRTPPAKAGAEEPTEATPAAPAAPVTYKQDATEEDLKRAADRFKRDKTTSNVAKMLRAQAFAAGEEAQFEAYYKEYALPRWTVPENYGSLPDFRKDLRRELLNGRSGPPYQRLLDLTFNYMSRISGPGFHPAVRYNATMVLGDLNVQEFAPGVKSAVEPLPAAQKVLLQAVKSSDSDAVRVAALAGLLRHANLGIADPQIRDGQFIPTLLDLAKSSPPQGRSADGHAWLRAMAIEVLGALHSAGPDGSVALALIAMIGDKNTPMLTRLAAARALGSLELKGFKALTPSQLAVPLGQLAVEACTAELARAKALAKPATKGGYPGMPGMAAPMMPMPMPMPMPGPMPGMPGTARTKPSKSKAGAKSGMAMPMPEPSGAMYPGGIPGQPAEDPEEVERLTRLRRNLKYYLNAVRLGLNGPLDSQNGGVRLLAAKDNHDPRAMAGSNDLDWKFVDSVFGSVQQQIKILDNDKVEEYETIRNDLIAARNKLREHLKGGPAPEPAGKTPAKGAAGPSAKK